MKRNRIIYIILCIAALVLASFYGGPVSYSILFGLLLVTPISLIYLFTVYHFFKLYQVIGAKHITVFEPVPYYFVLQNEYLLNFCNISVSSYSTFSYIDKMKQEENKNYELLPGEKVRYDTALICRYRGDYFVGIKEITIVDFFKLFKIKYHVPEPLNAVVSPRIVKLETLNSLPELTLSTFRENNKLSTDFDAAVREYVPGDPLKGINWKATAKTEKLQSRLTYGEQRQGISIFLETKRTSTDEYVYIPVENKCLEIVLALTNYFSAYSIPSTLFYSQGTPLTATCNEGHELDTFLNTVSAIKFRNDEYAPDHLDILLSDTKFSDCLVAFIVVTDPDVELNKRLYSLSLLGINIIVYYVGFSHKTDGIMELQNQRVIQVHPEDELEKIL